MSLKTRAVLVLVVGTVMGVSLSAGGDFLARKQQPNEEDLALEQAHLLAEVMKRVKSDYVEPIDDSELLESAIRGMVSDLDPHSQYLDAGEYRDIRISTTGSYTGIGIEVTEVDGEIQVISPIAGSPAASVYPAYPSWARRRKSFFRFRPRLKHLEMDPPYVSFVSRRAAVADGYSQSRIFSQQ